jgi:hypothetical protein
MESVKRLSLAVVSAGLVLGGSLVVFSSMSQTAWAIDTAPEIDPAAISGAMSLLIGSVMVLTGKCIRK